MKKFSLSVLFLLLLTFSNAQSAIDVLHYRYHLHLSDASDTLHGTAFVTIRFIKSMNSFDLDLASVKEGKGMMVHGVEAHDTGFSFTHMYDKLTIALPRTQQIGDTATYTIRYTGVPADGLIISTNRYNERTFFSDNWPNRAHQWIPCNDHPDDKATVEFEVTAPERYSVISNGVLVAENKLSNGFKYTHWREDAPIPTKVMVIGAARFAVKEYDDSNIGAPVSAWVYPQDSAKGFYDYALAPSILHFFSQYIGPYPFQKLANVQSKTIFGGMENAGAIFYGESTVTGDRKSEALLAHEIAHQWFGNSATERSFAHLWLSEGFASYMTHLYLEQKYGTDTLVKRLKEDRKAIIQFAKQGSKPVVDSVSPFMDLLNANSYQKGGWVLHMLRHEVNDSVFKNIIQTYYNRYKYSNADTWAFEKVAEEVSGTDLKSFFRQWLFSPGIPQIDVQWKWSSGAVHAMVQQTGVTGFNFPLEIGLVDTRGVQTIHKIFVNKIEARFDLPAAKKPTVVLLDPAVNLLFEGSIRQ